MFMFELYAHVRFFAIIYRFQGVDEWSYIFLDLVIIQCLKKASTADLQSYNLLNAILNKALRSFC